MPLTLELALDTERRLTELAANNGTTLETWAKQILEREAHGGAALTQGTVLEPAEFDRCLDELAEGLPQLPTLPAGFS